MDKVNCLRCNFRHEDNGNCTVVGGFCTAIPAAHCPLLREYLDTELTPEQCANAKIIIESAFSDDTSKAERIRELLKADRDGRVVVLPCKVGDTVYWVHSTVITECRVHRIQMNRNGLYICLKSTMSHGAFRVDLCLGKTVFFTREEAEAALEVRNGD